METINNLTTAASKAIWGETQSHEEPVAGKMGDVAAGEPYDAGNIGESNEAALQKPEARDTERSGTERVGAGRMATEKTEHQFPGTTSNEVAPSVNPTITPTIPTSSTEKALDTKSGLNTNPLSTHQQEAPKSTDTPKLPQHEERERKERERETTLNQKKPINTATTNPAAEAPLSSDTNNNNLKAPTGAADEISSTASIAGSAEDTETSTTGETTDATKDEDNLKQTRDAPVDVSGPGPRTLEEIARENGGNAGAVGTTTTAKSGPGEGERRDSAKGLGGEQGTGEGTGEEYIKSSGLNADGGDFDASRAGAGREADRLLEDKGIVHKPGPAGAPAEAAAETSGHHGHSHGAEAGHKEKVGLKDKIKAKLHKSHA